MIAEIAKDYRGVLCRRCHEPVPVSSKVISLQDEIEFRETHASCAFTLRCRICDHESVYAMTDVRRFEGDPRSRRFKSRVVGA